MKMAKEINLAIKKSEILEKIPNIILEGYRYYDFDGDQNLNILQRHAELNNFKYAKTNAINCGFSFWKEVANCEGSAPLKNSNGFECIAETNLFKIN